MMEAMELICSMGVLFFGVGTDIEGLPLFQFLLKSDVCALFWRSSGGLLEVF
jgi:hypothetical protein